MKVNMNDPVTGTFAAPIVRAYQEAGNWDGRVVGGVGAVLQFLWDDFFVWALGILFLSHIYDWLYGRAVARIQDGGRAFDPEKSRLGLLSKVSSVAIVFLVRLLEFAIANVGLVETQGIFAAGITVLLVVEDIHSIESKRVKSGAGPIPFLSHALSAIERGVERFMPTSSREEPDGGQD